MMQPSTEIKKTRQSKALWLAAATLIVLSAGYAVMPRSTARNASTSMVPPPTVEVQQTIAPAVAKAATQAQAPTAKPKPVVEVAKAKLDVPAETSSARKSSCSCETAETDLPDLCPDAACRQCKLKCGIMSH